jgi:hypothetical protein
VIPQRYGTAETGSLTSHNNICPGPKDKSQDLDDFGYTGGANRLTREQVREYFALWMAENARPFQMVEDRFVNAHLLIRYGKLNTSLATKVASPGCEAFFA